MDFSNFSAADYFARMLPGLDLRGPSTRFAFAAHGKDFVLAGDVFLRREQYELNEEQFLRSFPRRG